MVKGATDNQQFNCTTKPKNAMLRHNHPKGKENYKGEIYLNGKLC